MGPREILGSIYLALSFFFNCGLQTLGCIIWDLIPLQGIKPEPPALGLGRQQRQTRLDWKTHISIVVKGQIKEIQAE